ncbi:MAG: ArsA-related P-loop ATPase [Candidatus Woesearchaeota archaeon]
MMINNKLLIFGGKGGVGKTSCAAATAIYAASKGKKTLILSTDPAHSLSDSFEKEIGNKITRINENLEVLRNPKGISETQGNKVSSAPKIAKRFLSAPKTQGFLDALEIDAASLLKDYKTKYGDLIKQIANEGTFFSKEDIQEFFDLSLPGMDELMALVKIIDILEEDKYDLLILDTAPTGHTIRLLEMPQLLTSYVNVFAGDVLDALESGEIDAGHTWEPTRSAALEKGYKQLGKAGDVPGVIVDVLAFNSDFIKERPEDVQAIVKSMVEAKNFLETNREEAIKIMAEAEGMSEEDMGAGINDLHMLDLRDNKIAFSYAAGFESLHGIAKQINDFMIDQGVTDKEVDSLEFVDGRFIRNIE